MTENLNILDFLRAIFSFFVSVLILESGSFAVFWIFLLLGTVLYGTIHTKRFSIKPGYRYLRQFLMDITLAMLFSGIFLGYLTDSRFESLTKAVLGILILLLMIIWIVRVFNSKDWDKILIDFSVSSGTYGIFFLRKMHWVRMLAVGLYSLIFVIIESGLFMVFGLWAISILNQWIDNHKLTIFPQSRYFLHTIFDVFAYIFIFRILDDFPVDTLPFVITVSIVAAVFMQKAREVIWEH